MNTSQVAAPVGTVLPYRALIWLAVATFSNGIDGYVLAGLLPKISADLEVTNAAAGQLVSVFALTSALAAPVLGAVTSGWERRRTIVGSLAVFVLGNLLVALAPVYSVALGARVLAALGACVMNASITGYVIHLAPVEHRGKALSFVLGGWMTATALGVPVGLLLGQSNWRFPLLMVAVVGTVALVGIMIRLPHLQLPPGTLRDRLRPLRQPRLLAGLLVSTGILCASYTCFTYAVLILHWAHGWMIIVIMFGYGLASMLGNAVTGRLADRFTPVRVLTIWLIGLLVNAVVGAVSIGTATASTLVVFGLLWFFLAGIGNGGAAVPQQARLASMAPDSAAIVMALNGSAISLGSALGGALGGVTLAAGNQPSRLLIVAAAVLAASVCLHAVVVRISRPRTPALG
ncbi:MFS transporter [Microlunatus sp. Gsoil 973]|uniref:MFS transporter n=1 Tax=Microlunatus sp. Gsoil 973 TaxID=2672569 RepID=UPI0012B49AEC|nr:MFS transporter [Microlunatus sp. Gsoil 973]QGN35222.1 MFS transporter [Microlunatus sp. Gsoil 973]